MTLFFRAPSLSRLNKTRISVLRTCRKYATHRDPLRPPSLSQSLDTQHQPLRPDQKVGPFQMGINESPFAAAKQKKWSDLSTGGKRMSTSGFHFRRSFDRTYLPVKRTTARTTNLVVIVFGAGLTAVLLYAVTSELFSQNSPTVLYGEACERIKNSSQVGFLPFLQCMEFLIPYCKLSGSEIFAWAIIFPDNSTYIRPTSRKAASSHFPDIP